MHIMSQIKNFKKTAWENAKSNINTKPPETK